MQQCTVHAIKELRKWSRASPLYYSGGGGTRLCPLRVVLFRLMCPFISTGKSAWGPFDGDNSVPTTYIGTFGGRHKLGQRAQTSLSPLGAGW